jgi:hypothetical protein
MIGASAGIDLDRWWRGHFRRQRALRAQQRRLHIDEALSIAIWSNSSVIEVLPSVLVELMTDRPEMVENWRSSGVATEDAMVSDWRREALR